MPTVKETLKRLSITFTARDIMIPRRELVCAGSESQAEIVSKANPDFSIIPIRRKGKVNGYFERDTRIAKEIALSDLLSDGTSLLDLVEIFEDRQFCFILSHRQIAGYIHFSDLNHHLVKLTFYVILEALERKLLSAIQRVDDKEYLSKNLDPDRFEQIVRQYKRHGDAARNLFSYLNICINQCSFDFKGSLVVHAVTMNHMSDLEASKPYFTDALYLVVEIISF
jgi:hypothetical protein